MDESWANIPNLARALGMLALLALCYLGELTRNRPRRAAWREFCGEIGGRYVEDWRTDTVLARVGPWPLTLDTEEVGEDRCTRFRAELPARDAFRFTVRRRGPVSALFGGFWVRRIQTEDAAFDRAFAVDGNDEERLRRLLANVRIRRLLRTHADVELTLVPGELCLRAGRTTEDATQLRSLYDLLIAILRNLYPAPCAEPTTRTTEEPT